MLVVAPKDTQKTKLSNGRVLCLLDAPLTQSQVLSLTSGGLLRPYIQLITPEEHAEAIANGFYSESGVPSGVRFGRFAVYREGFESNSGLEIGNHIVWKEPGPEGKIVDYTMDIPNYGHPTDGRKSLREATGILDFDASVLKFDGDSRTISLSDRFSSNRHVRVINSENLGGLQIVPANRFEEGSTGYIGSFTGHTTEDSSHEIHANELWATALHTVSSFAKTVVEFIGPSAEELNTLLRGAEKDMKGLRNVTEGQIRSNLETLIAVLGGMKIQ